MLKSSNFSHLQFKKSTRLRKKHHQRLTRQAILFTFASLGLTAMLIYVGIPLFIKTSILLGNLKSAGEPLVSQDSLAPVLPKLEPLPEVTNQDTFLVQGFAEPGTTVQIYQNGQKLKPAITDNKGRFSLKASLVEGPNRFYATASDRFGNQSRESLAQTVIFDNQPPRLDIEKPENYTQTKERVIVIAGTTEQETVLTVNNRFVPVDEEGKFSTPFNLEEGENKIVIIAVDRAGNQTKKKLTLNYSL